MLSVAEDRSPVDGVVRTNPLEDSGSIVQCVDEYVHPGVFPRYEFPVHPDES
jgi:hypothetical protein